MDADGRREQLVRRCETAELMSSERSQRPAIRAREFVADHDGHIQRLGDCFDPADQVDRRTDDSEVETIDRRGDGPAGEEQRKDRSWHHASIAHRSSSEHCG